MAGKKNSNTAPQLAVAVWGVPLRPQSAMRAHPRGLSNGELGQVAGVMVQAASAAADSLRDLVKRVGGKAAAEFEDGYQTGLTAAVEYATHKAIDRRQPPAK